MMRYGSQPMKRRLVMTFRLVLLMSAGLVVHSQSIVPVGYSVVTADTGGQAPVGTALLAYSNAAGVLVSQAGVAATVAIRSGCIVVDEVETRTTIALVNAVSQTATATLILRDASGN